MVDPSYTITTKNSGTIQVDYNTNSPSIWTIGENASFTFEYPDSAPIEDFIEWAGSYSTLEMLDNTVKYRVQIPSDAGIDSLVWKIEPSSDLQNKGVRGVWGLLDNVSNERNQALTTNRYQTDVFVLAPYSEYADHTAVETDLLV